MCIDVIIEDERWAATGLEALAGRAARATLAHLGLPAQDDRITLLACDDARIAALNADFRGKPQPTNVLSWPSQERGAASDGGRPAHPEAGTQGPDDGSWGDIAIAFDTCAREAEDQGLGFADHVSHLVVHGILHLLGYDHIRDRDATLMEGLETAILGKLGIADPYREK